MAKTANCGAFGDVACPEGSVLDDDGVDLPMVLEGGQEELISRINEITKGGEKPLEIESADALAVGIRPALRKLAVAAMGEGAEIDDDAIEDYVAPVMFEILTRALGRECKGLGSILARLDANDFEFGDLPSDAEMKRGKYGALVTFLVGTMSTDEQAMVAKLDPGAASGDDGDDDYPFEPEDIQALIDNRGHPLVAAFIKALRDGDEGDSSPKRAEPEDDDEDDGERSPGPAGGGKKARADDPFGDMVILSDESDNSDNSDSEPEDGGSPEPAGGGKRARTEEDAVSEDEGSEGSESSDANGEEEVTFRAKRRRRRESCVASNVKKYMRQYAGRSDAVRNLLKPGSDPLTTMYEVCDALAATEIAAKRRAVGLLTQVFITAANARCDQAEHEIDAEKLQKSRRLELAQKRAKLKAIGAKIGDARAAGKTPNPRTVKSQGILKARVEQLIGMLGADKSSPEAGPAQPQ